MAIYSGFSHQKWWFSIATLNYQRLFFVVPWCPPKNDWLKMSLIFHGFSPRFHGWQRIMAYLIYRRRWLSIWSHRRTCSARGTKMDQATESSWEGDQHGFSGCIAYPNKDRLSQYILRTWGLHKHGKFTRGTAEAGGVSSKGCIHV